MLLKELEQARGATVTSGDDDAGVPTSTSGDEPDAQHVISSRLVTFRSIEELQEQNQRLLAVTRELSEKQDRDEEGRVEERTAELGRRPGTTSPPRAGTSPAGRRGR